MTKGSFFIRPEGNEELIAGGFTALTWPAGSRATPTVISDLAWNLAPLAGITRQAADLVHLAAGAYMADRCTARGVRFSRDLALKVAVLAPEAWTDEVLDGTAGLLGWLTGDVWDVSVTPAPDTGFSDPAAMSESARPVSLLSGGLDSFLGAIDLLQSGQQPLFVAHKDSATSVRHAQAAVSAWLARSFAAAPSCSRFALSQASARAEPTSRSRSLMFISLGIAAAVSSGSTTLIVPENGYTSINLPLRPNRGGALSTRSTHPETFHRVGQILDALGIKVTTFNPFEWMTKGEVMTVVAGASPPAGWIDAAALTLSCSKLDGNWFGVPNLNCGLCVSCMVRRATFLKAGIADKTVYVFESAGKQQLDALIDARRGDIEAVKYAIDVGVDSDAIDAGTWPPGYDLDRAEALVRRGLDELALLALP
jgi:hypothetical protein